MFEVSSEIPPLTRGAPAGKVTRIEFFSFCADRISRVCQCRFDSLKADGCQGNKECKNTCEKKYAQVHRDSIGKIPQPIYRLRFRMAVFM